MTAAELAALLRSVPGDAQVVVEYDAGCCVDADLAVSHASDDGQFVIRVDASYYASPDDGP